MSNSYESLNNQQKQFVDSLADKSRSAAALMVVKRYGGVVFDTGLWRVGNTHGGASEIADVKQWAQGLLASLEAVEAKA